MTNFDLNSFLPYQLTLLADQISKELAEVYQNPHGISVAEWRVLVHLHHEGAVSVRDIHLRAQMDKSRVSRAASRLCTLGLVQKSPDPSDGRLVTLILTTSGHELMRALTPKVRAFEARVLADLDQDAATFRALLDRLLARRAPGACAQGLAAD